MSEILYAVTDYEGIVITNYYKSVDSAWNEAKDFMMEKNASEEFHYPINEINLLLDKTPEETLYNYFDCRLIEKEKILCTHN